MDCTASSGVPPRELLEVLAGAPADVSGSWVGTLQNAPLPCYEANRAIRAKPRGGAPACAPVGGAAGLDSGPMLNLASETPRQWAFDAVEHLDDVLLDHAHCEKKAAGAAVRLLFRYPEHGFLQQPVAGLAREELSHFEGVLQVLAERSIAFARQKPSAYGGMLHQHVRGGEPEQLLDVLLVSALIEARSCERFRLLASVLPDERLAAWYRELLASEARHHHVYLELAEQLVPPEVARERLAELARTEAAILTERSSRVRLHSGIE